MLNKFWEGIGEGLAERWLSQAFGQALLFWGGGILAYSLNQGWLSDFVSAWANISKWISNVDILWGGVSLIGGWLLLAFSSALINGFQFPILRLLEGYWPWPFDRLSRKIAVWRAKRDEPLSYRLGYLLAKGSEITATDRSEKLRLENRFRYRPAKPSDYLPTNLGNILRSAERAPHEKYGLDAIVCWPHLWLLIETDKRDEISKVRFTLNQFVISWIWGVLLIVWTPLTIWALPIGLFWAALAYDQAQSAAKTYVDLIGATFDTQRTLLYESLRLSLPETPQQEYQFGEQVTLFLHRNPADTHLNYKSDPHSDTGKKK